MATRYCVRGLVFLALTMIVVAAVQASTINVNGSSFQSPTLAASPGYVYDNPDGWTGSDGPSAEASAGYCLNGVGGSTAFSNASGSQLALVYDADFNDGNGLHRGHLVQALGTIEAGKSYTAQVDLGALSTVSGDSGSTFGFALGWGYTDNGVGNGSLARVDVAATSLSTSLLTTFTINSGVLAANNPAVGRDLTVWLLGSGATPGGASCCFVADNVRVSSVVPEPAAATIVVTGLVGLLAYAWRKRR